MTKLESTELQKAVAIQQRLHDSIHKLGEIGYLISSLKQAVQTNEEDYNKTIKVIESLEQEWNRFTLGLVEKYGEGELNLDSGEYTN